jgi:hypothetical protein
MCIVINCGAAGIYRNLALLARLEFVACVCKRIVEDHLFIPSFRRCVYYNIIADFLFNVNAFKRAKGRGKREKVWEISSLRSEII